MVKTVTCDSLTPSAVLERTRQRLRAMDVRMLQHAIMIRMLRQTTDHVNLLRRVMTAMATAFRMWTVMEFAMNSKFQAVQMYLPATMTLQQRMKMGRVNIPLA